MAKIGRNDPCRCGSGKKHKKCCLGMDSAPATPMVSTLDALEPHQHVCHSRADAIEDELNERADYILDELLYGRVDHAEALCHDFMRDFPGEAEGIDLLSMIFEARGQRKRALELLREASTIAHANAHYDDETRLLMRERIQELELEVRA